MRMSFDHRQPDSVVSKVERDTVVRLGKFMTANGMARATAFAFCKQFMDRLNSERETLRGRAILRLPGLADGASWVLPGGTHP